MEVLRGSVKAEVTPAQAMSLILDRFLKNISSWACTSKIYILLHRCLQDNAGNLATNMARELKAKEHLIHSYQKKASEDSYEVKMYAEIIQLYNSYLKFLFTFKAKSPLLSSKMGEVSQRLKNA
jgi:deoxyadenosine/deoxycytidine kinase